MHYRCYFLNLSAAIAAVEIIEAETDAAAVAQADALFREKGGGYTGIEVWDRGRRVERVASDGPEQIRRWRMKAEELRTAADGFSDGAARQNLRNSAQTYEILADNAEARLESRKNRESETG